MRRRICNTKPSRHLTRLGSLASSADRDYEIVYELGLESLPIRLQPMVRAPIEDLLLDRAALVADRIVARVGSRADSLSAKSSPNRPGVSRGQSRIL